MRTLPDWPSFSMAGVAGRTKESRRSGWLWKAGWEAGYHAGDSGLVVGHNESRDLLESKLRCILLYEARVCVDFTLAGCWNSKGHSVFSKMLSIVVYTHTISRLQN